MAGSSNNIDTGALYFGTANPTLTGQEVDNDSFIVTSDGTPTGTPISFWKFDEETLTWVQVPSGNSCPAPMTRAALIALRNANGLSKDCDYVITDHVQGRLVAGTTIHLQAVSANELSENVQVNTTYDNEAWRGIYDIDMGLVLELQDNRNNIARGFNGTEVSNFDWGNTSYTNVLVDNSTLTVNIGNTAEKTNLIIKEYSVLNLTGFTGVFINNTLTAQANVNMTNANGTWRMNRFSDGGVINISNYTGAGDNYYNTIWGQSNINFSGTSQAITFRGNDIHNSKINNTNVVTAGSTFTLNNNKLQAASIAHAATAGAFAMTISQVNAATVNHQTGSLTILQSHINIASSVLANTNVGITNITNTKVEQNSSITNQSTATLNVTRSSLMHIGSNITASSGSSGIFNVIDCVLKSSGYIRKNSGSTGNVNVYNSNIESGSNIQHASVSTLDISRCDLMSFSSILIATGAVGVVSIIDTELMFSSYINKNTSSTAGTLNINSGTKLNSSSFISISGTGNFTATAAYINGSSGISVSSGNRNYNFTRTTLTGVSRANLTGTGAVTDNHSELYLTNRAVYNNSSTGAVGHVINYSSVEGLSGALQIIGTSSGGNFNRIKLVDGSLTHQNCVNSGTYQLINISSGGALIIQNHAANVQLNYIVLEDQGTLTVNKTGAGNITNVNIRNNGSCTMSANAGLVQFLDIEQGVVNISGGTINSCGKKMRGTWIINGGSQFQTYHYNTTNKTTIVNNTNRVNYLGVLSSVPIL